MNRFFLESHLFTDKRVKFPEDIAHQIIHVLRMNPGDEVIVLDDEGFFYTVELVIDPDHKTASGTIINKAPVKTEPRIFINLCFGMTNRDKVELILQKGTEIGVSEFSPFISSRSLVQSKSLSENKFTRWNRIIREAAEQSHRGRLPMLNNPMSFEESLSTFCHPTDLSLIAWEALNDNCLKVEETLKGFKGSDVTLFVGPEGGFSEDEVDAAERAGCQAVSLGKRILRMETAALIFPAIVLYELGDL